MPPSAPNATNTPVYNLIWSPREISIGNTLVSYTFGDGNPAETDRSAAELLALGYFCDATKNSECGGELFANDHGYIETRAGTEATIATLPFRMTKEIESQVLAFLSDPVISQSSQKCGEHFFQYTDIHRLGHTMYAQFLGDSYVYLWDPYYIDINYWIVVNPYTGRKELNSRFIENLWAQITPIEHPVPESTPEVVRNAFPTLMSNTTLI